MCGFAGVIDTLTETHIEDLSALASRMAETIQHRGPDDAGVWVDERARVALAFRRLAILDLSPAGHQPMVSHGGRYALVFNGEIYNHRELKSQLPAAALAGHWAGHSDTETLLVCMSTSGVRQTLERAVGMFAFALWDRTERRLTLGRDRFGEKPLYYGWTPDAFLFGSELKALRAYPRFESEIDRDVLALYTEYNYVPSPYSIYRNAYKVEPACILTLSLEGAATAPSEAPVASTHHAELTVERYWSLTQTAQNGWADPLEDEDEATDRLEAALAGAVRLQSIADVPLGAFLSGGIDSSVITALMQTQSSRRVQTFTIGFEESGYNEGVHAKAVARHLGTNHTELYVSAQQAWEVIPRLPDLYLEPFADSSQIPTHLVSSLARQDVTVALSGDGGDELFGGYTRHAWAPRIWRRLGWLPALVRRGLGAAIGRISFEAWTALGRLVPEKIGISKLGEKAHKLGAGLTVGDLEDLYRMLVRVWPPDADLVQGAGTLRAPVDLASAGAGGGAADRIMLWDALTYLPDDILHKVDRASMGVSLETRAPFLDHRVAELAYRLRPDMKIRSGQAKWIVRQLLDRHVPRGLVERSKMGFALPIGGWLRGPLRDWAESLLNESVLESGGYLNAEPIRRKWAEHVAGRCTATDFLDRRVSVFTRPA